MNKLHYTLVFFALLITLQLDAQDKRPFYGDIRVGNGDGGKETVGFLSTISLGYRINGNHAIGLGCHYNAGFKIYNVGWSYVGYGVEYRYATKNGLIAKVGGGRISNFNDLGDANERYTGGGNFYNLSIDYQLGSGLTLGVYHSSSTGALSVDYYLEDGNVLESSERWSGLSNTGLSIGYSWPRRKRDSN